MKKTIFFIATSLCLLLCCCENPERSRDSFDKGVKLLFYSSKFDEAEKEFTEAIKYDKNNHEAYYYRGCTKFNRNLLDEAILDFEKALELHPGYADAEFALGRIYFIKEDRDMACFYYKASMEHGRANVEDDVKGCP